MLDLPNAPPVKVGELLASKYRVERILGMGGMGVVVAATHLDLDQKVALKFLLPASAERPGLVERFSREARASVRLKSPHVARTLDTGRLENGCPFIVMEFLEGRDLDAELSARGAPFSVEEAASYVLQACDALAEAHAAGIIHRDLKPANLFLTRGHDGRDHVKVLDFGISKLTDPAGSSESSLTTTSTVFGSPAYMSPEQMRSSKEVDERTDIWSIGVVLYELLTCRLPFEAPTALEIGLKASQDAAPSPRALRPDLPEALEWLILRCLEKEPRNRFGGVGELASALAPFAHVRDRAIAERVADIARAGTGRPSDEAAMLATSIPPAATSNRSNLALAETQLAITTETKPEPRAVRPLAFALLFSVAIAVLLLFRHRGTPEAEPKASDLGNQPGTASATIDEASPSPSIGSATSAADFAAPAEITPAAAGSPASAAGGGSARAPGAAASPVGHRPSVSPAKSGLVHPPPAASSSASISQGGADAGRFFRVRE